MTVNESSWARSAPPVLRQEVISLDCLDVRHGLRIVAGFGEVPILL